MMSPPQGKPPVPVGVPQKPHNPANKLPQKAMHARGRKRGLC